MMILKIFERLLNIDDINCKWGIRFMFFFCVILRCSAFFNPYSDTDFSWLNGWMSSFESENANQTIVSIPFTSGNIVFLVTIFFALFFTVMMGILYSALFVRSVRLKDLEKEDAEVKDKPLSIRGIFTRLLPLSLFYLAVSIPFVIISSNLLLFFLIGFPMVFTAPCCYLSGDKGMFKSIPYVVRLTKGFYLAHVRSLFLLMLVFFFTNAIAGLVSYASVTAFYILSAGFATWVTFAFGRYAGMAYYAMRNAKEHTVTKLEKEGKIG